MIQGDVQATMPNASVLVARPIIFDLSIIAQRIVTFVGKSEIDLDQLSQINKQYEAIVADQDKKEFLGSIERMIEPFSKAFTNVKLPTLPQIMGVIQQAAYLDWDIIIRSYNKNPNNPLVSFTNLLTMDSLAIDRAHGVCAIPLYEFSESDWQMLLEGTRIEEIQERLKQLDIFQYFFPAADHLAIGLVDRGLRDQSNLAAAVESAPTLGHPFGPAEIVQETNSIPELIDALQERNLLVEGELGLEITPSGTVTRSTIKFRPREGTISKIIQRLTLNVDVKPFDLLKK